MRIDRQLAECIIVLLAGYTAGMQLGKIAPLIFDLRDELGVGLVFAGWLTAMLGLFVAIAAAPVSRLVLSAGVRRSLQVSGLIMVTGALTLGMSTSATALLASRGLEGLGYVAFVVAAPSFLRRRAPDHLRGTMLALWGSFVPIGFALANLQAGLLSDQMDVGNRLLTFALPLGLLVAATFVIQKPAVDKNPPPAQQGGISRRGLMLAACFGLYVYISIGFFSFLPSFLTAKGIDHFAIPPLIALCVPVGNFFAAAALAGRRQRFAPHLALTGFAIVAFAAAIIYAGGFLGLLGMSIFALGSGLGASGVFASVAVFMRDDGEATRTIGAIAQAGGIATLLGPPFAGALIEYYGWTALAVSFAGAAATAIILISKTRQRSPNA